MYIPKSLINNNTKIYKYKYKNYDSINKIDKKLTKLNIINKNN